MSFDNSKVSPRVGELGYYRKGNYGEEDLVSHIDDNDSERLKRGHKCLLSIKPAEPYTTTARSDFRTPWHDKKKMPIRQDLMERLVYEQSIKKYIKDAYTPGLPYVTDYMSETAFEFNGNGFVPMPHAKKEKIPDTFTTFWTENVSKNVKRSSHFTKPISERMDEKYF